MQDVIYFAIYPLLIVVGVIAANYVSKRHKGN